MATATFGAGCFWGVEEAFREREGVTDATVGYAGGDYADPSYEDVCSGKTGHAEVVRVEYDPARLSYEALLELFFAIHDPTPRNRQGPGGQYRSLILYHTPEQERTARDMVQRLQREGRYRATVATEIEPAGAFWRAEEYHQCYLDKRRRSRVSGRQ